MSRIDEMIAELCPDGVEYKRLGDIGTIYGGLTGKSKEDFKAGNAKYVPYTNVYNHLSVDFTALDAVFVDVNERQNEIQYGDVLITGSSETPNDCGMSSVVMDTPKYPVYLNSFCFGWRPGNSATIDAGYLKYIFRSHGTRKQIVKTANGVTRFNISKEAFKRVEIPVPPIEVQKEIVRILDKFAKLEAELEAELEARKAQYAYYRDKLLSFERERERERE